MKSQLKLQKDKFSRARGGWSRMLRISCEHCGAELLKYQKDGPGALKRMYVDRIVAPEKYLKMRLLPLKNIPILRCEHCKMILGTPYLFKKEKRPAFRLYQNAVENKIICV